MAAIQDPILVINSMQERINQLERELAWGKAYIKGEVPNIIHSGIRSLRHHGVISLCVRGSGLPDLKDEVVAASPELVDAIQEVWFLDRAPLAGDVKKSILTAANNGMSRW